MDDNGLIRAWMLDGAGGGRAVSWDEVDKWQPHQGVLWVHLDRNVERAHQWVREDSGVDEVTADALLAEETRPRTFPAAKGLGVILRGVNLNPGADPEDMVGLRIFAEQHLIITIRYRKLMAVSDVSDLLEHGKGPKTPGDFLSMISDALVARMESVVDALGESADAIETDLSTSSAPAIRRRLREMRQEAIVLKRYLTPQRDVMARLQLEQHDWLSEINKLELREVGDRITRYIEELEEVRDRAVVLQDELLNQLSESSNRTMYILTIVAAVMLPLSFITGLLGINVAGMPGSEDPTAFWIVCLLLVLFAGGQMWLFRKLRWV
jgi:zinc transporter